MTATVWPPADPTANVRCGECGRRRVDGHARGCASKPTRTASTPAPRPPAVVDFEAMFERIKADLRAR